MAKKKKVSKDFSPHLKWTKSLSFYKTYYLSNFVGSGGGHYRIQKLTGQEKWSVFYYKAATERVLISEDEKYVNNAKREALAHHMQSLKPEVYVEHGRNYSLVVS